METELQIPNFMQAKLDFWNTELLVEVAKVYIISPQAVYFCVFFL